MKLDKYKEIAARAEESLKDRQDFASYRRETIKEKKYSQADLVSFLRYTNKPYSKTKVTDVMDNMIAKGHHFSRKGVKGSWELTRLDMIQISEELGVSKFSDQYSSKPLFILMGNLKGGVGKSLCSNMLAHYLCYSPRFFLSSPRVLLLDLDPQGTLTQQNQPVYRINDDELTSIMLLVDSIPVERILENAVKSTEHLNIDLIQCGVNDGFLASELADKDICRDSYVATLITERIVKKLENHYDIIIGDVGPHLDDVLINTLWAADLIFIPVPPKFYSYDSTLRFLTRLPNVIEELIENGKPESELADIIPFLTQVPISKNKRHSYDSDIFAKASKDLNTIFDSDTIKHELPFEDVYERCADAGHSVFSIQKGDYSGDGKAFTRALTSASSWASELADVIERKLEERNV